MHQTAGLSCTECAKRVAQLVFMDGCGVLSSFCIALVFQCLCGLSSPIAKHAAGWGDFMLSSVPSNSRFELY